MLALLQSTRCSQSGKSGWASLEDTWDRRGASCFLYDIENMFEFSLLDFGNDLIKVKLITLALQ